MSFVTLLKCAFNYERPRADLALAAILLDRAGLTPDSLAPGAIVVIELDGYLIGVLETLFQKVFPDRLAKFTSDDMFGSDLWIANGAAAGEEELSRAAIAGATLVVAVTPAYLTRLASIVCLAASNIYATDECRPEVVEQLLALLFDTDVEAPEAVCSVEQLMVACRPAVRLGDEAARILRRLVEPETPPKAAKPPPALDAVDLLEEAAKIENKAPDNKNRGASNDKPAAPPMRLRDLAGYGEAKTWGLQLARDLAAYRAGRLEWRDVDKGLMLSGPPGCGKSYFARALAAECGVQLVVSGYDDWHEASNGDTVSKTLKKRFKAWRELAAEGPIIVFVDELDTIGTRGAMGHNDSWFGAIVNTWLAFLDGAEPRDGVVVIGATNFPSKIDPALLRPGRLERQIVIPAPTIDDIAGFLRHHLGRLPDLARAARVCRGRTPAEIAKIAREARRAARLARRKRVTLADVMAAVDGGRRRDAGFDRLTAIHEAGHALISVYLGVRLLHLDVDASETVEGAFPPVLTLADVEKRVTMCMGGRAAEEILLGAASTGAIGDFQNASAAAMMALRSGLLGPMVATQVDNALIDLAIRRRVDEMVANGLERARAIVRRRIADLRRLADAALRDRYLDGAEIAAVLGKKISDRIEVENAISEPQTESPTLGPENG
jgi:ATP-dependent Zn protease